ncbi:hypothetical protein [Sinorhizobium meliloti]|uniref:hypothetical protein n=1 Tax=Rhizobium meliloti TaxID=382 RepID=UPI000FDBE1BB|nr:hypothetical protein [Sinorhizobium meliloti]RVO34824.1 hypothetical protein CN095_17035 [Sinorhizobium meliloti]
MSSNVIQFPQQESIVVTKGTDIKSGRRFLLEYVLGGVRTVVGEYGTLLEVAQATIEWERDGVPLREWSGWSA